MPQFVLVANVASGLQLEKAMEIKNKSNGKITLIPQSTTNHSVTTQGMSSMTPPQEKREVFNSVRFEWDGTGIEHGVKLLEALAHQPEQEPKS